MFEKERKRKCAKSLMQIVVEFMMLATIRGHSSLKLIPDVHLRHGRASPRLIFSL